MSSWLKLPRDVDRGSDGGTDARDARAPTSSWGRDGSCAIAAAVSRGDGSDGKAGLLVGIDAWRWVGDESAIFPAPPCYAGSINDRTFIPGS